MASGPKVLPQQPPAHSLSAPCPCPERPRAASEVTEQVRDRLALELGLPITWAWDPAAVHVVREAQPQALQ